VTDSLPLVLASGCGDKPAIRIEGRRAVGRRDQLAGRQRRWDVEEDLARLIGDAPAHTQRGRAPRAASSSGPHGAAEVLRRLAPGLPVPGLRSHEPFRGHHHPLGGVALWAGRAGALQLPASWLRACARV
jgi:hypothetical protein